MHRSFNIRFPFPLIVLLSFFSCTIDKSPMPSYEASDNLVITSNTWADTLFARGIASEYSEISIPNQRAALIQDAKIQLHKNLLEEIYNLPINEKQTIHDLSIKDDSLDSYLKEYAQGFTILDWQLTYRDTVIIDGCILTNQLKTLISSSLDVDGN